MLYKRINIRKAMESKFIEQNVDVKNIREEICKFSKSSSIVPLVGKEREHVITSVINKLIIDNQIIGDKSRKLVWEKGWKENLDNFKIKKNYDVLLPKFVRNNPIIRWDGKYCKVSEENFEAKYVDVLRAFIFSKYLKVVKSQSSNLLAEFGVGSGLNLISAHKVLGNSFEYLGLDFSKASVQLMSEIKQTYKIPIQGFHYDMKNPRDKHVMKFISKFKNKFALTSGSIEQLASSYEKFIDVLIRLRFNLVIHVEPLVEFYDENSLEDSLALLFHKKRGYSQNLLNYLRNLQNNGKIEILDSRRLGFGSLMMEGFNLIVWKPIKI